MEPQPCGSTETTKKRKLATPTNGEDDDDDDDDTIPLNGIVQSDLDTAVRVLHEVLQLGKRKGNNSNNNNNNNNNNNSTPQEPSGLDVYCSARSLRPLRKALAGCMALQTKLMYRGKPQEQHFQDRYEARSLKRQKESERHFQKQYIATTELRRGRVERLQQLQMDAQHEELQKLQYLIPDGHVETSVTTNNTNKLLEDRHGSDTQKAAKLRVETVDDKNDQVPTPASTESTTLPAKLRSCYVCKVRFRQLHTFYDQLCPTCATFNWQKRHQTCDLTGKVAIVTGSRVKIGYHTCLKLLRAGATVVATTRFPNAAAHTYRQEADFEQWKQQLQIYGMDLRDVTGLEAFTRFLKQTFSNGIDIVINNACQTVRRPRGYYVPLVEREQELWMESDGVHKSLLEGCVEFERVRRRLFQNGGSNERGQLEASPMLPPAVEKNGGGAAAATSSAMVPADTSRSIVQTGREEDTAPFETTGLSHSAAMSQMIILPEDAGVSDKVLPPGLSDVNGQQLDLRKTNSWLLKMEEVSTPEIMECMFINAIAPFVLNSRLKPLLAHPPDESRPDRYIINVSAMEGKFYRYKMPNHPHTNMAKAALNMMTRTSAEDLAKKHRIFMNAVDTGWINDENPLEKASKIAKTNLFQTPIDEIDAAARILDPVFMGVRESREAAKVYGKFLKDYRETEW